MTFDIGLLQQYAPDLLSGLRLTIEIWLAGSLIALAVGMTLGIPLTFARPGLRLAVRCYVEFFRGTPLLVQLYLLYYGGPRIGLTLNAMTAGLIGLGLYGGAYFAELRSLFEDLDREALPHHLDYPPSRELGAGFASPVDGRDRR